MTAEILGAAELPTLTGDPDFDAIFKDCLRVLRVKGHDYTKGSGFKTDRLGNFKAAAQRLGLTPEQCLAVHLDKHMAAIFTYCGQGQVESEPIDGRIVDAINYLLLLGKMVREKREKQTHLTTAGK